jgi:Cdc6-like AAA superfamily ATPase
MSGVMSSGLTVLTAPPQTTAERIFRLQEDCWVPYPLADEVLAKFEYLFTHALIGRMPNLLLYGPQNNGKSMMAKRFRSLHPKKSDLTADFAEIPVVYVQAPPGPSESRFYTHIFGELKVPMAAGPVQQQADRLVALLHSMKTRLLIIDEIQHLLAGSRKCQHQFLNVLKYLGNELQIPMVLVGVETAQSALGIEPQVASRFREMHLPAWRPNVDWSRMMKTIEKRLDLALPSNLADPVLALKIHAMTGGLLGEAWALLKEAAVVAIKRRGPEQITAALLDSLSWATPRV